jgi:hypothetical protein
MLRVTIHRAAHLAPCAGFDPFVRLALHAQSFESGVRRRMVDPDFGAQHFDFRVWSMERARLRVDVLGWQAKGPPLRLLRPARAGSGAG